MTANAFAPLQRLAGARGTRFRRPLLTLSVLAAMTATLATLGGCNYFASADTWAARAETAFTRAEFQSAERDVANALNKDPHNARALVVSARLMLKVGKTDAAQRQLDSAVHAGMPREKVAELQSRILLADKKFADAESLLEHDHGLAAPLRAALLAEAQIGQHHLAAADATLAPALQSAPDNVDVRIAQTRLRIAQDRPAEALAAATAATNADPRSAMAWFLRGRILLQQGAVADAVTALEHAHRKAMAQLDYPDFSALLQELGNAQMDHQDVAGAEKTLAELDRRFPNALGDRFLHARIAVFQQDYPTAVNDLQTVLSMVPDFVPARLLDAAALLYSGQRETAEAQLNGLLSKHPDNLAARKLLAQVELALHRPAEAQRVLRGAPAAAGSDAQSNWLMGMALLDSGATGPGIGYLERSVAEEPDHADARLKLAQVYIASGQGAKAVALLEALKPAERSAESDRLLVVATAAGKPAATAKRALADLLASHPDDNGLLAAAGLYAMSLGDLGLAQDELDRALQRAPGNLDALMGLAQLRVRQSRFDDAEKTLRAVVQAHAKFEPAYWSLAALAVRKGDRNGAEDILRQAISANPSAVQARLMLAELTLSQGDAKTAQSLLDQAAKVAPNHAAVLDLAGRILLRGGLADPALADFNGAVSSGSQPARVDAARALIVLGRNDEARRTLSSIADTVPQEKLAAELQLIGLDVGEHNIAGARHRIAELRSQGLPAYAAAELDGNLDMFLRQYDDAGRQFASALAAHPDAGLAIRLFQARLAARAAEPQQVLVDWTTKHPADRSVPLVLAQYYAGAQEQTKAIGIYERLMQGTAQPELPVLNNLAYLYTEVGDPRAVATARRAFDLAPDNVQVQDTYGWALVRAGKAQQGISVLEKAEKARNTNPAVRYHLAAALAQTGDTSQAKDLLSSLLQSGDKFPERGDAEALQKKLQ